MITKKQLKEDIKENYLDYLIIIGIWALLPGVFLAKNIVVGAGSIVTKSFFQENVIIAGNPAKIVKVKT